MLHRWLSNGTPERDRKDPAPELTIISHTASSSTQSTSGWARSCSLMSSHSNPSTSMSGTPCFTCSLVTW